jgi:two-component system osmolarity sensor histidine kinase EnvZ
MKKFIKNFIPITLFSRMLLIIIIPTIIAQLISTYIFYHRHWDNVSDSMIYSLAGEIAFISELHQKLNTKDIKKLKTYTNLKYVFFKDRKITIHKSPLSKELKILQRNLQNNISNPINLRYNKTLKEVEVQVQMSDGMLFFEVPHNRFYTPTTYIFILWMVGITSVLLIFTIIFSKNQIKSITKLSMAAEKFGTGQALNNFKPEGAIEVRKAGLAFLEMKQRIENQIRQRTEMLAGVSHDLRTPITRINLQLALMKPSKALRDIKNDIQEMESIINDYLDFAKGEDSHKVTSTNLNNFLKSIVQKYKRQGIDISLVSNKVFNSNIRSDAFKRAVQNLIDNATRFASKIEIHLREEKKFIVIEVNDNGPGIDKHEMKKVFQPFYRVEHSRNQTTGGIGLGLSIAQDIIIRHGGNILLEKSSLGGLKASIIIPK